MLKPSLFLSYARIDSDAADRLLAALRDQDCLVLMDRHEILAGDDFVRGAPAMTAGT